MSAPESARRLVRGAGSLGAIVFAAVVPKCPICIAAALAAVGAGASFAQAVAPIVRPVAVFAAVAAGALLVRAEWSRRTRRSCAGRCVRGPEEVSPRGVRPPG